MHVEDTLEFLLGRWSVVRTLTDHRAGLEGRFEGRADVREGDPDVSDRPGCGGRVALSTGGEARWATYEEVGRFRLARHDGVARRHLRYRNRPDASLLVEFADGRPLLVVDLRDGHWSACHDCGPDRYDLSFVVRSPETFEEHWHVRGPSKDYEARALFVRDVRPAAAAEHHQGGRLRNELVVRTAATD